MKNLRKISLSLFLMGFVSTALSMVLGAPALLVAVALFVGGLVKGVIAPGEMPLNLAYDGFVISDVTYAGEAASQFIVKAITANTMVQDGHIYVRDGIKYKFTIPRWDAVYTDLIQERQATPIAQGNMTVSGQALTLEDYMIYTEFNPRDFEQHWFATQLNPTLVDRTLPASVESTVIQQVLKRHDRFLNEIIWKGDKTTSSYLKYFNGLKKKASDSGDTLTVSSPTNFSTSNIAGEFERGYAKIPFALRYDPEMKFFVSYKTFDLWRQYQYGAAGSSVSNFYKGIDVTQMGVAMFAGLPIVKVPDFPDDYYMIAKGNSTPGSNLWLGMNSVDDPKIYMNRVQNNSELWFVKMLMKVDVQIGWNAETVTYG
jgi:hypothetical protein